MQLKLAPSVYTVAVALAIVTIAVWADEETTGTDAGTDQRQKSRSAAATFAARSETLSKQVQKLRQQFDAAVDQKTLQAREAEQVQLQDNAIIALESESSTRKEIIMEAAGQLQAAQQSFEGQIRELVNFNPTTPEDKRKHIDLARAAMRNVEQRAQLLVIQHEQEESLSTAAGQKTTRDSQVSSKLQKLQGMGLDLRKKFEDILDAAKQVSAQLDTLRNDMYALSKPDSRGVDPADASAIIAVATALRAALMVEKLRAASEHEVVAQGKLLHDLAQNLLGRMRGITSSIQQQQRHVQAMRALEQMLAATEKETLQLQNIERALLPTSDGDAPPKPAESSLRGGNNHQQQQQQEQPHQAHPTQEMPMVTEEAGDEVQSAAEEEEASGASYVWSVVHSMLAPSPPPKGN